MWKGGVHVQTVDRENTPPSLVVGGSPISLAGHSVNAYDLRNAEYCKESRFYAFLY